MLKLEMIPKKYYDDIREFLDATPEDMKRLSVRDALDAYLKYNGIIGHTLDILNCLDALDAAHKEGSHIPPQGLNASDANIFILNARIGSAPTGASIEYLESLWRNLSDWATAAHNHLLDAQYKKQMRAQYPPENPEPVYDHWEHAEDSQCTVDPATHCCTVCGVNHSTECLNCGGRGFHKPDCEDNE